MLLYGEIDTYLHCDISHDFAHLKQDNDFNFANKWVDTIFYNKLLQRRTIDGHMTANVKQLKKT